MIHLVASTELKLLSTVQSYLSTEELALVKKASEFAIAAHDGVMRKSGEPYVTHPIAVANILADLRLNADTIAAALLHDVIEDTPITKQQIENEFNHTVADLVDAVTKFEESEDKQTNKAATFKKIIAATLHDPRVMVIKLADRLHNLSTLGAISALKRKQLAQETMQTFVPVGRLLGLHELVDKIELICLQQIDPEWFLSITQTLQQHKEQREQLYTLRYNQLLQNITELSLDFQLEGNLSDTFVYQQAFTEQNAMATLLKTMPYKVVVPSVKACVQLANSLKNQYQYHTLTNHIEQPLPGGQQFLDLQLYDANGITQVRIQTPEMRQSAIFEQLVSAKPDTAKAVIQASLKNLEGMIDQDCVKTSMQDILHYLHHDKIMVYTKDGHAIELPQHATVIDFAYTVSLYLGNHLISAQVDGNTVALNSTLKGGQTVVLEISSGANPNPKWLGYVVTPKARRAIQQQLRSFSPIRQITIGRQALKQALQIYQTDYKEISEERWLETLESLQVPSYEALFLRIAMGDLVPQFIAAKLCGNSSDPLPDQLLKNLSGVHYRFAQCCNPIPGDRIFGHLTRRGIAVHRFSCPHMNYELDKNPAHLTNLEWQSALSTDVWFSAVITIHTNLIVDDFTDIIKIVQEEEAGVELIKTNKDGLEVQLVVKNRQHLAQILRKIRIHYDFPQISRALQFIGLSA